MDTGKGIQLEAHVLSGDFKSTLTPVFCCVTVFQKHRKDKAWEMRLLLHKLANASSF